MLLSVTNNHPSVASLNVLYYCFTQNSQIFIIILFKVNITLLGNIEFKAKKAQSEYWVLYWVLSTGVKRRRQAVVFMWVGSVTLRITRGEAEGGAGVRTIAGAARCNVTVYPYLVT